MNFWSLMAEMVGTYAIVFGVFFLWYLPKQERRRSR